MVIAAVLRMHVGQGDFLFGFSHYYRFNNAQMFLKACFLFSVPFFFFFFSPLTPVAVQWKVVLHPVFSFVLNHTMISQMCTYPRISFGLHVKNLALCE